MLLICIPFVYNIDFAWSHVLSCPCQKFSNVSLFMSAQRHCEGTQSIREFDKMLQDSV